MSVRKCIDGKASKGVVSREMAKQAMDLFAQNHARLENRMRAADAAAQAGARTIAFLERELARKKANAVRQAQAAADVGKFLDQYRTVGGGKNGQRAAMAILNRDPFDQATFSNVWARQGAILGQLHSAADNMIIEYRAHVGGFSRNKAGIKNVIRELYGVDTGDEAAKLAAKAWRQASEVARKRFNRAGGNIPKRQDWVTVQSHDMLEVSKVKPDEWIAFITNKLDRAKMIDESTGLPMSDRGLNDYLVGAHEEIATGGWSSREPNFAMKRSAMANTRRQPRELHFKNADVWLEYQEKFGKPSIFDAMTAHLEHMSMDIAQMEILGPNPQAMVSYMGDLLREQAAGKGRKAINYAEKTARALARDFDELSGKNAILNTGVARGFSSLANILTSAQLGAATLTAVSDLATLRLAAKFNGVPAAKVIARLGQLMAPGVTDAKRLAIRAGFVAENYSSMAMGQARYVGEIIGPRWSQMFSDAVLKISGLSPWTQAGRWAFGLEFTGHLGDFVGKTFADMPVPTREALARYGIGEADWAKLATMKGPTRVGDGVFIQEKGGAEFLSPAAVMAFDQELGTKISQMIISETEFAVPTVTTRVRRQLRLGADDPNTFAGMAMRSVAMYKSFPVGIIHSHLMRGLNQNSMAKKGRYLASLIATTTLMGAVSWQMKHISKGRDFENMDPRENLSFWMKAMGQGGGLGLFSDFLFADMTRFGQGALQQVAGPIAGFADDVFSLTAGNVQQYAGGTKTNLGKELIRFTHRYLPGSSLWYSRLALERLIFDELERMVDPNAAANFRRSDAARRRETGQKMFWGKGDRTPSRMPNMSAAIGR